MYEPLDSVGGSSSVSFDLRPDDMVVRGKKRARVFLPLASSIILRPNTSSSCNSCPGEALPLLWNPWMVSDYQYSYMTKPVPMLEAQNRRARTKR